MSIWKRLTGAFRGGGHRPPEIEGPEPGSDVPGGMELGSTGLRRTGGHVHEEWHPRLSGRRGRRIYREMRDNDATIGAVLYAIESLILQAPWNIEVRGSDPTDEQIAVAEFVRQALFVDMMHTWSDFLSEVLSMIPYGWVLFEVVYKRRSGEPSSHFNDGKIGWRKFGIRSQETLDRWEFNDHGDVLGMHQQDYYTGRYAFIPIAKSLHFKFREWRGNPEGRSGIRNAYRSWWMLKRLQSIEAVGAERDLAGLPVMQVPPRIMDDKASAADKKNRASFFNIIKNIRRDEQEGVLMPAETGADGKPTGFKLELLTSGGKRAIDIAKSIDRYQKDIAMTLLAQFLFLGMDRVGSFALAETNTDLFAVALGATMDRIADTINRHAIPPLMKLNGIPQENWPILVHGDVESRDLAGLSGFIKTLVDAGAMTPGDLEPRLREIAGLPPREAAEAEAEAPVEARIPTGIQIKTATDIAIAVKAGDLDREQGLGILVAFYGLTEEGAGRILGQASETISTPETTPTPETPE